MQRAAGKKARLGLCAHKHGDAFSFGHLPHPSDLSDTWHSKMYVPEIVT